MESVLIFVPNIQINQIGFLEGYSHKLNNNLTFYLTNISTKNPQNWIGFASETTPSQSQKIDKEHEAGWLHYNICDGTITLNGINKEIAITVIHYNLEQFKRTEIVQSDLYYDYFKTLVSLLRNECKNSKEAINEPKHYLVMRIIIMVCAMFIAINRLCGRYAAVMKHSALLKHLHHDTQVSIWLINEFQSQQHFSVRITNGVLSKITDILLGSITLYYLIKNQDYIIMCLQESMEFVIEYLKQLLLILMGSPAGLKLNFAFNRSLGIFAFYNISLWKAFLQTMTPLLQRVSYLLFMPGIFGLSYQVALLIDVVTFISFHVYCIYIYAARLYGLQIKTLISLGRLFTGRKYNPLRERVDSSHYTHQQLFVGTLGFTIFLFLLPTTLLYYTVFTLFRIFTILSCKLLEAWQLLLRHFPAYVISLWLCDSEKIKGKIHLQSIAEDGVITEVHVDLKKLPLIKTIYEFTPGVLSLKSGGNVREFIRKILLGQIL